MGYELFLFYPVLLPPESLGLNSYLLSPIVLAKVARETTKKRGGGNQLWCRVWEESLTLGPEARSSDKSPC